jgi:hypothetical protein
LKIITLLTNITKQGKYHEHRKSDQTHYADYQTAYRTGYEGYDRYGHTGRAYSNIESDLQRDYEANQTGSLTWESAKPAVRDAWERASSSFRR